MVSRSYHCSAYDKWVASQWPFLSHWGIHATSFVCVLSLIQCQGYCVKQGYHFISVVSDSVLLEIFGEIRKNDARCRFSQRSIAQYIRYHIRNVHFCGNWPFIAQRSHSTVHQTKDSLYAHTVPSYATHNEFKPILFIGATTFYKALRRASLDFPAGAYMHACLHNKICCAVSSLRHTILLLSFTT